jgi:uncharacterized surface protein with fasciclin (FAS1) repeats
LLWRTCNYKTLKINHYENHQNFINRIICIYNDGRSLRICSERKNSNGWRCSNDHTTLVAAVKAAGLVETLKGKGPFTVFAPTNAAFDKLPKGTVETLLKPENKAMLQSVLTYHVVAGKMNASDIAKAIKAGNGKATLTTVQGGKLTAWMDGKDLYISDENGGKAKVTIADVNQSNGVIHVVDAVVTPKG